MAEPFDRVSGKTSRELTFLTQGQRQRAGDGYPNQEGINQLYGQLNNCIQALDKKVGDVLRKHESDFLNQYKKHMIEVQTKIRDLQEKANEDVIQEKRKQKIAALQEERDRLKTRAVQLDSSCKELKQSVDKWKNEAETLEDDRRFIEEQIAAARKQNQRLKDQLRFMQQAQDHQAEDPTPPETPGREGIPQEQQQMELKELLQAEGVQTTEQEEHSAYFQQIEHRYQETLQHLNNQLEAEKRNLKKLKASKANYVLEKGEFEDIFIDCVEEVKKDILTRRARAQELSLKSSKHMTRAVSEKVIPLRDSQEVKLEHFTDPDRRKVMELFISHEKVLDFLHEKLFQRPDDESPSRSQLFAQSTTKVGELRSPGVRDRGNHGLQMHKFSGAGQERSQRSGQRGGFKLSRSPKA